jgi:hypothetical protein
MEVRMNVKSITVFHDPHGLDYICVQTDLEPSVHPFRDSPGMRFEVAHGGGEEYCARVFPGIPVEVVNRFCVDYGDFLRND